MIPRIYTTEILTPAMQIKLTGQARDHLIRVLRLQVGDALIVFNGRGGQYTASIAALEKKVVSVQLHSFYDLECESPLDIHLGQGLARGDKMDWLIQKAVELGVNQITPLVTQRSQITLTEQRAAKKIAHWRAVIASACEQCGRNQLPQINKPMAVDVWCQSQITDMALVLEPTADKSLTELLSLMTPPQTISLLVGPASGFSSVEITQVQQHGFIAANLGVRILRTETAALSVVAILQHKWGM